MRKGDSQLRGTKDEGVGVYPFRPIPELKFAWNSARCVNFPHPMDEFSPGHGMNEGKELPVVEAGNFRGDNEIFT